MSHVASIARALSAARARDGRPFLIGVVEADCENADYATRDGRVTIADYFAADRGRALRLTGWANGDFDGSGGAADAADYMLLDRAFLNQSLASPAAAPRQVPEPSATATLAVFAGLLQRRWHRPARRRRAS